VAQASLRRPKSLCRTCATGLIGKAFGSLHKRICLTKSFASVPKNWHSNLPTKTDFPLGLLRKDVDASYDFFDDVV